MMEEEEEEMKEIDRNLIIVRRFLALYFLSIKLFSSSSIHIILFHCLYVLFRYIRKWHIDRLITGL